MEHDCATCRHHTAGFCREPRSAEAVGECPAVVVCSCVEWCSMWEALPARFLPVVDHEQG